MVTDQEPYAIDTDRHRSRVVISPQAATEPEYTLEKKGHTSVIRVSYPGPGGSSDIGDNGISEQVHST